eukprot:s2103_g9.t1
MEHLFEIHSHGNQQIFCKGAIVAAAMGVKEHRRALLCFGAAIFGLNDLWVFINASQYGSSGRFRAISCKVDHTGVVDTVWATSSRPNPPSKDEAEWEKERQSRRQKLRSQQETSPDDLFASKSPGKGLAKDIKDRIQETGRAMVRAVGPASTHQALKAIAAANAMLQGADLYGDQVVATVPSFQQIRLEKEEATTVAFLNCMLLPRPRDTGASVEATQILATGSRAKISKMSAAIKNRIRENSLAVVLAVGSQQVSFSVKAVVQAGRFLREDQGAVGDAVKVPSIALIPRLHEFAPKTTRPRKEMKKGEDDAVTIGMRLECVDISERFKEDRQSSSSSKQALPPWEQDVRAHKFRRSTFRLPKDY